MKILHNKYDVYKTKYYLKHYKDNYFRIVINKFEREKGWVDVLKRKIDNTSTKDYEEVQRCSLSRTKRNIRELALCNNFEYFATFTINGDNFDRFDLEEVQNKLRSIFHKIKRKHKDFIFLFITEKHKNGAFHFHGLISNPYDLYINDNGYLSSKIFDELGFNSFSKIKDYIKTCNYITKYITKDCVKNIHNQIYFCSRGLKKADKFDFNYIDIKKFNNFYENDFCIIKDFNFNELSIEEQGYLFSLTNKKES